MTAELQWDFEEQLNTLDLENDAEFRLRFEESVQTFDLPFDTKFSLIYGNEYEKGYQIGYRHGAEDTDENIEILLKTI